MEALLDTIDFIVVIIISSIYNRKREIQPTILSIKQSSKLVPVLVPLLKNPRRMTPCCISHYS